MKPFWTRWRRIRTAGTAVIGVIVAIMPMAADALPYAPIGTAQRYAHATESDVTSQRRRLREAHGYNHDLLTNPPFAGGEAPNVFAEDARTPSWRSDERYLNQLGGGNHMASIRIPSIGVDLPIGHGASADVLAQGAGHVYGTMLPIGDQGNSVIAAHRGSGARLLFYRLGELRAGSLVYTQSMGRTVIWRVEGSETVTPGSTRESELITPVSDETTLTLYTCDPPGLNTGRLIVRARMASQKAELRGIREHIDPARLWLMASVGILAVYLVTAFIHSSEPTMRHGSRRIGTPWKNSSSHRREHSDE